MDGKPCRGTRTRDSDGGTRTKGIGRRDSDEGSRTKGRQLQSERKESRRLPQGSQPLSESAAIRVVEGSGGGGPSNHGQALKAAVVRVGVGHTISESYKVTGADSELTPMC